MCAHSGNISVWLRTRKSNNQKNQAHKKTRELWDTGYKLSTHHKENFGIFNIQIRKFYFSKT